MNRRMVALGVMVLVSGGAGYVACGGGDNGTIGGMDSGRDAGGLDATTGMDDVAQGDAASGADGTTTEAGSGDASNATDAGGDANSAPDAGNAADAGGDANNAGDAGADAMITGTGGPVTDASLGGDATSLNCGSTSCHLPNEACCFYPISNPPPPFYAACSSGGSCPTIPADAGYEAGAATEVHCEVQANCGGNTVCCVEAPASGNVTSHCVSASACNSTDAGSRAALLCDMAAADAGCGGAGACSSANIATWNLPNGFGTCGGVSR
jgi:hypothetical protein